MSDRNDLSKQLMMVDAIIGELEMLTKVKQRMTDDKQKQESIDEVDQLIEFMKLELQAAMNTVIRIGKQLQNVKHGK